MPIDAPRPFDPGAHGIDAGRRPEMKTRISDWVETVRENIKGSDVPLPKGCIGRCKEKWRPLARVAAAAGGEWPATVQRLIEDNMTEEQAEREAGLKTLPPGMVVMIDLYKIWPIDSGDNDLVPTLQLVAALIDHNPEYWGADSPYGKPLTAHRLGRILSHAKITSRRPGGRGPKGYLLSQFAPVWRKLGISVQGAEAVKAVQEASSAQDAQISQLSQFTQEAMECLLCGEELVQPESIARGTCLECNFIANPDA